ncbi:MAG: dihydroneopterin aldolase [bacterium]
MDRILINNLKKGCIIGVTEEERSRKQDVSINISLQTDLHKPGRTDNIIDTVDYSVMEKRITEAIENSRFFLLEALAEKVAEICLEATLVESVTVKVEKRGEFVMAESVAVEITRDRERR